jgi:hypothetical protein
MKYLSLMVSLNTEYETCLPSLGALVDLNITNITVSHQHSQSGFETAKVADAATYRIGVCGKLVSEQWYLAGTTTFSALEKSMVRTTL